MSTDQASRPPASGRYEALNVFGARIGLVIHCLAGELLPRRAPRGFPWRLVTPDDMIGSEL